jgi:hypothetical protein
MPKPLHTSREFKNAQVLIRFIMRLAVLCVFATLGNIGFAWSLVTLLWMSAILSVAVGIMRRESVFDAVLTYWDEAAAYGSLCCLATALLEATAP